MERKRKSTCENANNDNKVKLLSVLREGTILTDTMCQQWRLGPRIGNGGFGDIYLASDNMNNPVTYDAKYIVKVEPFTSGPLFVEVNFYARVGKTELIENWIAEKKLDTLGMPHYLGFGAHTYKNEHNRFLVLPKYGTDLQTLFLKNKKRFNLKTTFAVANYVIDILAYMHSRGYLHGDIKASNLVLSERNTHPVFLVDYGLASKFYDDMGNHKRTEVDQRRAHMGTSEFVSRDGHVGAYSRRGDLETLGYNVIKWLTGSLPWEGSTEMEEVAQIKNYLMADIPSFIKNCFQFVGMSPPDALVEYLKYINSLKFTEEPDYNKCRTLFENAVRSAGFTYSEELSLDIISQVTSRKRTYKSTELENDVDEKFACNVKKPFTLTNEKCRLTRKSTPSRFQFDWPTILSGNPEKPKARLSIYDMSNDSTTLKNISIEDEHSWVSYYPDMRGLDNPTPAMKALLQQRRIEKGFANVALDYILPKVSRNYCSSIVTRAKLRDMTERVIYSSGRSTPEFSVESFEFMGSEATNSYSSSSSLSSCSSLSSFSNSVPKRVKFTKSKIENEVTSSAEMECGTISRIHECCQTGCTKQQADVETASNLISEMTLQSNGVSNNEEQSDTDSPKLMILRSNKILNSH